MAEDAAVDVLQQITCHRSVHPDLADEGLVGGGQGLLLRHLQGVQVGDTLLVLQDGLGDIDVLGLRVAGGVVAVAAGSRGFIMPRCRAGERPTGVAGLVGPSPASHGVRPGGTTRISLA